MTTPPRVTDEQVAAAIARIIRRHRGTDHPGQHLLSTDPREVLLYLRRCGAGRLLGDDESHDVEDGLTLRLALWWEGELAEYRLLTAAEKIGLNRRRVGRVLGVTTGQGLLDRLHRKVGLFGPAGRPNEKAARADLRAADVSPAAAPAAPPAEPDAGPLRRFVARLLDCRDALPDDLAEDVTLLRRETTPRAELSYRELENAVRALVDDLRALDTLDTQLRALLAEGAQLVDR